jgi:hypothetical protein
MIIKGKYFSPPPAEMQDFKGLFRWASREGVGRLVDNDNVPLGPWTPELMVSAIASIETSTAFVDVRTVQRWFQDNDQGIKTDNIRLLARVFGCGDPDATRAWQVALTAAQARLASRKRTIRTAPAISGQVSGEEREDGAERQVNIPKRGFRIDLPKLSEVIFSETNALALPTVLWTGFTALAFLSYIFGVQTVTYSPLEGAHKQVGFLWAPSWTLFPILLLPMFLTVLGRLLHYWKREGAVELIGQRALGVNREDIPSLPIRRYASLLWATLFVCFVLVFAVQWSGVHLRSLLLGDPSGYMIDWNNVALVRPEIVSVPDAIILSLSAYFYYGLVMWLLLAGLIMLVVLATHFQELCSDPGSRPRQHGRLLPLHPPVSLIGSRLMVGVYRCSVLAIMCVICIKLQSTYLITSAESMTSWLLKDATSVFSSHSVDYFYLGQRSIPQLTTLIILAVILLTLFTCVSRVLNGIASFLPSERYALGRPVMILIVALLSSNVILIGAVPGFSLLLGGSLIAALYSFYKPPV